MLITLSGSAMLAPLRSHLLPSGLAFDAAPPSFNLRALLALVSTIAVCCKGGVGLISGTTLFPFYHIFGLLQPCSFFKIQF